MYASFPPNFVSFVHFVVSHLRNSIVHIKPTVVPNNNLPVFEGEGGLCPGVDLSDGQRVQEALDRDKSIQALR